MGHDHHFLSRLDRVTTDQVEFALSLYRDHEVVKELLHRVTLPEGADRVAIAIHDGPKSPHIVLQRDGHFVTCLGAGMLTGRLPIVERKKVDTVVKTMGVVREQVGITEQLRKEGGLVPRYLRLANGGRWLSQEEVTPLFRLAPLIGDVALKGWVQSGTALDEGRAELLARKGMRRDGRQLESWWRTHWGHAHMAMLGFAQPNSLLERLPAGHRVTGTVTVRATRSGELSALLRTLQAAASAGKGFIDVCERQYWASASESLSMVADAMLNLTALGLRHPGERARIAEVLTSATIALPIESDQRNAALLRDLACTMLADPTPFREAHRRQGQRLAVELGRRNRHDASLCFARAEDVPDELAFSLLIQTDENVVASPSHFATAFARLPFTACAAPEALFVPRRYLPMVARSYKRRDALRLLWLQKEERNAPATRSPMKTPRNELCPCESGIKYKRCCAFANPRPTEVTSARAA